MNHYGARIRQQWVAHAPRRLAELQNPEQFFTDLGALILGQVSDLVAILGTQRTTHIESPRFGL